MSCISTSRITYVLVVALLPLLGCGIQSTEDATGQIDTARNGTPQLKTHADTAQTVSEATPGATSLAGEEEDDSPGRRLTNWVLAKGGQVYAETSNGRKSWKETLKLPPGKIEPINVTLEGAVIRDEEMAMFAGHLKLRSLRLNQSMVTDGGLKQMKDLPKLEFLSLGGTKVSDAGMKHLAQIPSLRNLLLNSTQVGDAGMKTLSENNNLGVLQIIGANVTDAGLAAIGKMKSLYVLNLGNNNISDAGIKHLEGLKSMNSLGLHGTKVSKQAAAALDEKLSGAVSYDGQ